MEEAISLFRTRCQILPLATTPRPQAPHAYQRRYRPQHSYLPHPPPTLGRAHTAHSCKRNKYTTRRVSRPSSECPFARTDAVTLSTTDMSSKSTSLTFASKAIAVSSRIRCAKPSYISSGNIADQPRQQHYQSPKTRNNLVADGLRHFNSVRFRGFWLWRSRVCVFADDRPGHHHRHTYCVLQCVRGRESFAQATTWLASLPPGKMLKLLAGCEGFGRGGVGVGGSILGRCSGFRGRG
jgi:hypothetical protein